MSDWQSNISGMDSKIQVLDYSKTVLIEHRQYRGEEKDYCFIRTPGMLYTVLQDGAPLRSKNGVSSPISIDSDMSLKKYKKKGFLKKAKRVSVLGVSTDIFEIHIPTHVRFSNGEYVDGRVTVVMRCDLTKTDALVNFLNREGQNDSQDYDELCTKVTAKSILPLIGVCVSDYSDLEMANVDQTLTNGESIWTNMTRKLVANPDLHDRGLIIRSVRVKYNESKIEALIREGKLAEARDAEAFRARMRKLNYASEEYDYLNGM